MQSLFDPADFHMPEGVAHLCAAGETPVLRAQAEAFARHLADKGDGPRGRARLDAEVERLRDRIAAFWSVTSGDIGFVSSVAEGMSMLVESLDWLPGDSVLVDRNEYASVVAPASRRGIALRFARFADPDDVARQVQAGTRIIAVSAVSYYDARRHDLAALRRIADKAGALLVVDFTQASGWLPIEADVADFAFSACYKWMLSFTGTAIAYWNRARQPRWRPGTAGWYSIVTGPRPDYAAPLALREDGGVFTRGNPAHLPCLALHVALDFHARFPRGAVQRHVQALTVDLLARLRAAGIDSITPPDPAQHGASVCIAHEDGARIVAAMQEAGVFVWNGRGRIRISFHGYNATAELDRVMDQLRHHLKGS